MNTAFCLIPLVGSLFEHRFHDHLGYEFDTAQDNQRRVILLETSLKMTYFSAIRSVVELALSYIVLVQLSIAHTTTLATKLPFAAKSLSSIALWTSLGTTFFLIIAIEFKVFKIFSHYDAINFFRHGGLREQDVNGLFN